MVLPLILLPLTVMSGSSPRSSQPTPLLDGLVIAVEGASREVAYTNTQAGFFYTETNAKHRTGWQGWHIFSHKMLDDYEISIDGTALSKEDAVKALVDPSQLTRIYRSGLRETVTLLDVMDALVVQLEGLSGSVISAHLLWGSGLTGRDFVTKTAGTDLLVSRSNHSARTPSENFPVWIGMRIMSGQGRARVDLEGSQRNRHFSPAGASCSTDGEAATILVVAGDTEGETVGLLNSVSAKYRELIDQRRARMERLLSETDIRTDNPRFDKAIRWALLSMDALIMNQGKKGIFAGLPWFSNYWGRDSFISLPGATLVTGRFEDAREILRSFAEWQNTDSTSSDEGRIPNLVTPTSISYNTADGTPWFVIALGEYVRQSGDTTFARQLFPAVQRAAEGTLRHHVDANGFLIHADAETWMDAVGPNGPWSPRGNRAADIQALWYRQIRTSSWLAGLLGDREAERHCGTLAEKLRENFLHTFIDSARARIYDHLNSDGTPDLQDRPNQLFALPLLSDHPALERRIFARVTRSLVYQHGVASLCQDDENFHPFHHYAPYYVQDAAYHNGIVWTWLAGPWIDQATRFGYSDLAWEVTDNMVHQILDRGGVGTLSELLDAAPRGDEREPELSGTFTQAWSLAEFLRVFYEDYLGIRVNAIEKTISVHPRLPSALHSAGARIRFGASFYDVQVSSSADADTLRVIAPPNAPEITLEGDAIFSGTERRSYRTSLQAGPTTQVVIGKDGAVEVGGDVTKPLQSMATAVPAPAPLALAVPIVRPGLKSLQGPSYRMLTHAEIKSTNPGARLICNVSDPTFDDVGTGKYVYPAIPQLKPGSLDITSFRVTVDERNAYFHMKFRTLSDPGWHPEYGFQLTYVAVAIRTDNAATDHQRAVGMNSGYTLPPEFAFDRIVYVGGGVRVADASGKVLAEYSPVAGDERNPLGNVANAAIEFAVPLDLLAPPGADWRFTVLVGAQDDHGGAGIGEFRTVAKTASEWVGGGKRFPDESNIYDSLVH